MIKSCFINQQFEAKNYNTGTHAVLNKTCQICKLMFISITSFITNNLYFSIILKIFFIVTFCFGLNSCGICPEPVYIEYDQNNKIISSLSEIHYIKSITITEYKKSTGSISLIDSNKSIISQIGERATKSISLINNRSNYFTKGKNVDSLLSKSNLHFEVLLGKFGNKKNDDPTDLEMIEFSKPVINKKVKFNSKHPCP